MAMPVPETLQTPEVVLRAQGSVMAPQRSIPQWLLDMILGGSPAERMGGIAPMRIGVLPGRERLASDIIKRGLKEPWFHGTPSSGYGEQVGNRIESLLRSGFSGSEVGQTSGLRLGEPAGVSLTRSPEVARKFGDVLRVGVDIPPSSVGQFVDPEMQRLLREGYTTAMSGAMEKYGMTPAGVQQWLKQAQTGVGGVAVRDVNQAMSDYLRNQGVEAIAYNPRRWAEYELRVLDPSKAVPLGNMPPPLREAVAEIPMHKPLRELVAPQSEILQRYLYGKNVQRGMPQPGPYMGLVEKLRRQYFTAPEFPVLLRDVLGVAGAD